MTKSELKRIEYYQTAKARGENNIPYLISCDSTQTDEEILQAATNFYGTEMVTIEKRTNICPV